MDNNNLLDRQEEVISPQLEHSTLSEGVVPKGMGLGWRVALAVIALLVIVVLAYPLFQQQFSNPPLTASDRPASGPQSPLSTPTAADQTGPLSADAQFELGNSYVQAGQWAEAVTAYQKTIELDPNFQAAYANLGVAYYQLGEFDLAASQYEKALELNSDDVDVAYNLGALYLQQALSGGGQPDLDLLNQAISQLEQVKDKAPDLAEPYFSLGVAYIILNRNEEAIDAFESFLARDSGQDSRAREEAEGYLQHLQGQ
jgi:tetratricopeptide (TPR) repeat protein